MRIEHFRYLFKREIDVFYLTKTIVIYKKPFAIHNTETDEYIKFKTLDDVLKRQIGTETVKQIIEKMDKPYIPPLEGGRGAGSGSGNNKQFKFSHASDGGGGGSDESLE